MDDGEFAEFEIVRLDERICVAVRDDRVGDGDLSHTGCSGLAQLQEGEYVVVAAEATSGVCVCVCVCVCV